MELLASLHLKYHLIYPSRLFKGLEASYAKKELSRYKTLNTAFFQVLAHCLQQNKPFILIQQNKLACCRREEADKWNIAERVAR